MKILVDIEERRSAVPEHLGRLGVDLEFAQLTHGDYVIDALTAVERKTVADLHRSIVSARIWGQISGLATFERSYVIVEGRDLDAGPISTEGVRGAILQIVDNGVAVLQSSDARDTALWLRLLKVRGQRSGRLLGRRRRRRLEPSPVGYLSVVPGISPSLALALLERFGSIAGVAAASPAELREIPGIGPARAAAMRRVFLDTFPRSG